MSSIIEGYRYDIFISYRQKDNKGDRWVSEFVDALRDELESTFKEEISLYFDVNPNDGLLESHEASDSLKDKLKCLVFVPILSRTYCDLKSFAWENEFVAFVEQASKDQFGLKVKLPGGNVAGRVLPVRIHDLDSSDIAIYEAVTGSVLRGVEFIYKSPGVNRPLRPKEEKPQENLNNTIYRDQINKVSLAIKDIILGLRSGPSLKVEEPDHNKELIDKVINKEEKKPSEPHRKSFRYKFLPVTGVVLLLIIALIIFFPEIFDLNKVSKQGSADKRISVAVLPFQNMTNDAKLNNWQLGIQNELINSLTNNTEELRIEPQESVNELLRNIGITTYSSIKPSVFGKISTKLNANVFISGSINQSGSIIRINAQITDSGTGDVVKSFKKEGSLINGDLLSIIDPMKEEIKNFLIISGLKEEVYIDPQRMGSSDSPEAYRYFTYGLKAFAKSDFPEAINMLTQAVASDSNLTYASLQIGWAYYNQGFYDEAKKWCLKAYQTREQMPLNQATYTNFVHARFFTTPNEAVRYLKQLQDIDDQWPQNHYDMGITYCIMYQFERAIPEFEKALEIYNKKDIKPWWPGNYINLGLAYTKTRQYEKEDKLYKKALVDFPEYPDLIQRQAILALTMGNTSEAEKYIEKYRSVSSENSLPEATLLTNIAFIYNEAGIPDKAEEFYHQVLSLQPENPENLYNLAWLLIDRNRDINKGMELIERALKIKADNFLYLDCKGWGLYRQGKVREALDLIEKAWNLKPVYDQRIFLHLEELRKAVLVLK